MALTTSIITGRVPLPTGDAPKAAELTFRLSGIDFQGGDVLPPGVGVRRALLVDGQIPANFPLWRNTEGINGTYYTVTARWAEDSRNSRAIEREEVLGKIQVGDAPSYELAALLAEGVVPAENVFYSTLTQLQYDAAIGAAGDAQAAEAAAALYAAQAALYGPLTFRDASAFFASNQITADLIGKRAGTQDGLAWDIVAPGSGTLDHPVTGIGLQPVPVGGWLTLEQFGAIPGEDDNLAEGNTYAMQEMKRYCEAKNGINLRIKKHFRIGHQTINPSPSTASRFYQDCYPMEVYDGAVGDYTGHVVVDFAGGSLRMRDGLHYGSFDPLTGARYNPSSLPFTNTAHSARVGNILAFTGWASVAILSPEINGNNEGLILGGQYGDTGRQNPGSGIHLVNNLRQFIDPGTVKNCALDNLYIGASTIEDGGILPNVFRSPHTKQTTLLDGLKSSRAGRQAFSLTGGIGGYARNCSFIETGRNLVGAEAISSSPGACLDIEGERGGYICDWLFEDCEFLDSDGVPMVADTGNSADVTFRRCKFRSKPTGNCVWPKRPNFVFEDCIFVGPIVNCYQVPEAEYIRGSVHSDATKFRDCVSTEELNAFGEMCGAQQLSIDTNGSGRGTLFERHIFYRGLGRAANGIAVTNNIRIGNAARAIMLNCEGHFHIDSLAAAYAILYAGSAYLDGLKIVNRNPSVVLDHVAFIDNQGSSLYRWVNVDIIDPTGKFTWTATGGVGKILGADATKPLGTDVSGLRNLLGAYPGIPLLTNWSTNPGTATGTHNVRLGAVTSAVGSGELLRGDILFLNQPSAGGAHAVRCTTSGTAGSTAVTKSFGNLEA